MVWLRSCVVGCSFGAGQSRLGLFPAQPHPPADLTPRLSPAQRYFTLRLLRAQFTPCARYALFNISQMTYRYEPLDDPDNEIRLAAVQPGAYDDPIRIQFKHRRLQVSENRIGSMLMHSTRLSDLECRASGGQSTKRSVTRGAPRTIRPMSGLTTRPNQANPESPEMRLQVIRKKRTKSTFKPSPSRAISTSHCGTFVTRMMSD